MMNRACAYVLRYQITQIVVDRPAFKLLVAKVVDR